VHFDGATTPAADVLDECRSFGLLAQHKLVIVDQADQFVKEANRPLVERYAENPSEGATLVLRSDKWNKGKLDGLIESVGAVIPCQAPTEPAAIAWAVDRADKRYSTKLEQPAAALLIERLGPDLGRIDSELAKLSTAAGEGKPITVDLVSLFVGISREEEVWSIQSTLLSGDAPRILTQLREILEVSRQPPTLISYAFIDLARKVHGLSAGIRAKMNPFSLMKPLKLWGSMMEVVTPAATRTDPHSAAAVLAACIQSDLRQKTGLGSPERSLEITALTFANPSLARRR
jgi:DNA polymerase-3 subunit delta